MTACSRRLLRNHWHMLWAGSYTKPSKIQHHGPEVTRWWQFKLTDVRDRWKQSVLEMLRHPRAANMYDREARVATLIQLELTLPFQCGTNSFKYPCVMRAPCKAAYVLDHQRMMWLTAMRINQVVDTHESTPGKLTSLNFIGAAKILLHKMHRGNHRGYSRQTR